MRSEKRFKDQSFGKLQIEEKEHPDSEERRNKEAEK